MRFSIQEFKNYLNTQDSRGDIYYNLTEGNIKKANQIMEEGSCMGPDCLCEFYPEKEKQKE